MSPSATDAPKAGDVLLDSLTEEQRAAVEARSRFVIVTAPPGSGKTRALAARIVSNVRLDGMKPWEVLALTFTRSASAEIRKRAALSLGEETASQVRVPTFHALALRFVRLDAKNGGHLTGLPETFTVADDSEVERELKALFTGARARKDLAASTTQSELWDAIGAYAAKGQRPAGRVGKLFDLLNRRLAETGLVMADRLIPLALRVLECRDGGPLLSVMAEAEKVRTAFREVLVDEAHDCTPLEAAFVMALVGAPAEERRLWLVQDPRQAIFAWRGGQPDALENLVLQAGQLAHLEVRRVNLRRSFRFGPELAAAAQDVLGGIGCSEPLEGDKEVETRLENVEARSPFSADVEEPIRMALSNAEPGGAAVLVRTNQEASQVASLFPQRLEYVGPTANRTARLWPLWAVCRLLLNPADTAAAHEAWALSPEGDDPSLWAAVQRRAGRERTWLEQFRRDVADGTITDAQVPALLRVLLEVPSPDPGIALVAGRVDAAMEWGEELRRKGESLQDLVFHLGLVEESVQDGMDALLSTPDADLIADVERRARIPVLTIHAAKGREWDRVVLIRSAGWPERARDPEERRICFVAMTRARRVLATVRVNLEGGARGRP